MTILDCAILDLMQDLQNSPQYGSEPDRAKMRNFRTTPERAHALIAAAKVVLSLREALEIGI